MLLKLLRFPHVNAYEFAYPRHTPIPGPAHNIAHQFPFPAQVGDLPRVKFVHIFGQRFEYNVLFHTGFIATGWQHTVAVCSPLYNIVSLKFKAIQSVMEFSFETVRTLFFSALANQSTITINNAMGSVLALLLQMLVLAKALLISLILCLYAYSYFQSLIAWRI